MLGLRNKFEEMEAHRRRTNFWRFVEGLLIGHIIGILVGLLIAPKSGKETVETLSEEAKKFVEKGKDIFPKKNNVDLPDVDLEELEEFAKINAD